MTPTQRDDFLRQLDALWPLLRGRLADQAGEMEFRRAMGFFGWMADRMPGSTLRWSFVSQRDNRRFSTSATCDHVAFIESTDMPWSIVRAVLPILSMRNLRRAWAAYKRHGSHETLRRIERWKTAAKATGRAAQQARSSGGP
jgi:hypothetical protein